MVRPALDIPTGCDHKTCHRNLILFMWHMMRQAHRWRDICMRQGYEEYIFFGNTTDDKYLGFIDGMANECREFRKHLTIISSKDSQVIEAALKEHFAKTTGKTGIFAYNDRRAVQMMGILQKMKIRVPEQVGIVGFDNIYLCEVLYPSLSSIAQPNETMASLAVQRLLYRMDHPNDQKREDHPLHAELICRQSSDLKGVQQA